MKTTIEPVYHCDFCNRGMRNKGAMTQHERMCRDNPQNDHICFKYCKNLIKGTVDIMINGDMEYRMFQFKCAETGKLLYSYKFERNSFMKEQIENQGLQRMPLDCSLYVNFDENH